MEQRDYLQKQIDQLGQVLGKILSDLLGLKNQGQINEGIELTNQALKKQLDLDIEELISISTDNLINILKTEKNISTENMDKLAELLLLIADHNQDKNEKREMIYEKCLTIYEYLEKTETTFSFDRHLKIERIKNVL